MDEVDGMSAGDRGGVGALNGLIKKTKVSLDRSLPFDSSVCCAKMQIPMILICNDKTLQKMKPLMNTTFGMTFKRYISDLCSVTVIWGGMADQDSPQPNEVRSRIMSILYKFASPLTSPTLAQIADSDREKMKVAPNVIDELVRGANSDIRLVLNMLSTYKLGQSEMDFDEGKALYVSSSQSLAVWRYILTLCIGSRSTRKTPSSRHSPSLIVSPRHMPFHAQIANRSMTRWSCTFTTFPLSRSSCRCVTSCAPYAQRGRAAVTDWIRSITSRRTWRGHKARTDG